MQQDKPPVVDVYDLDGTILRGNSFTQFVVYLFTRSIARLDLFTACRLATNVLLRKIRVISHHEMKRRTVGLGAGLSDAELARFVSLIAACCQTRLAALRNRFGQTPCSMLATAAPSLYANPLGDTLGFDHVIASDFVDGDYVETIRERKRDRVLALAATLDLQLGTLFTDHLDDLSIAFVAPRVVAVDASAGLIDALVAAGRQVDRFDFRRLD